MAEIGEISVRGLREFNRTLRQIDSNAPKGLRLAGNAAAAIVVTAAKPKVPTGPGRGGHAKTSVKAASTRTAARVRAGGKRFPYFGFIDFGGSTGPGHRPGVGGSGSVKRRFIQEGRYVWKSFGENRNRVEGVLRDELADVARRSGAGVRVR